MTLLNNGNVGIGTTGPGAQLEIARAGNALHYLTIFIVQRLQLILKLHLKK